MTYISVGPDREGVPVNRRGGAFHPLADLGSPESGHEDRPRGLRYRRVGPRGGRHAQARILLFSPEDRPRLWNGEVDAEVIIHGAGLDQSAVYPPGDRL